MYLLHIRGPRIESPWAAYSPAIPFSQWLPPEIIISLYIEIKWARHWQTMGRTAIHSCTRGWKFNDLLLFDRQAKERRSGRGIK